jgi:hypothetical protein
MGRRGRLAVIAAFGLLALAPAAGFGQAGPAAPPAGEAAPDTAPVAPAPEGGPLPRVLPAPPGVLPLGEFGPGIGGRDCESEQSPGTGV